MKNETNWNGDQTELKHEKSSFNIFFPNWERNTTELNASRKMKEEIKTVI